jgi:hypothetical protein
LVEADPELVVEAPGHTQSDSRSPVISEKTTLRPVNTRSNKQGHQGAGSELDSETIHVFIEPTAATNQVAGGEVDEGMTDGNPRDRLMKLANTANQASVAEGTFNQGVYSTACFLKTHLINNVSQIG